MIPHEQLSFSQCGEDRMVDFIFRARGLEHPTYMDIGAHHPTYLSNTALFHAMGCRGVNIEPDPTLFEAFPRERVGDVNLNIGIAERSEERDFFILNAKTLNTFSREGMEEIVEKHPHFHVERVAKVRTEPLQSIVDLYCGGRFPDFLSLDVEGLDEQILSSILPENAPKVVCVETIGYAEDGTGRKSTKILDLMKRKGYMVFGDTNINTIFVRRDFWILDPARRQEEFWFQVQPSTSAPVEKRTTTGTVAIAFSKDRAFQLDGLLRSFRAQVEDWSSIDFKVLYATSSSEHERTYQELAQGFSDWERAELHREGDFRADLLHLMKGYRHVLFLVDDTVFTGTTDIGHAEALLDSRPDILGLSLRLGRNSRRCYTLARDQQIPTFQENGEFVCWRWPEADADFGYPLEVSSSLYRVDDIRPLLETSEFTKPNSLEDALSRRAREFAQVRPIMASHPVAKAFSVPANVVQDSHANRHGDTDAQSLLKAWQQGRRMDVTALSGLVPDGAHMELDLLSTRPVTQTNPLVSIVVPCYNQARFLPECVGSVIAQTYAEIELLLVDDGSPDDTAEVASRLIAENPERKISLLRKANGGLSSARNHGIAASRGKYILPLDNDDLIEPTLVAELVQILESRPEISIASTDMRTFGAENRYVQVPGLGSDILRTNGLPYCSMYRREVWETVGGYSSSMRWGYEDWCFWVSCWSRGFKWAKIPKQLFLYRVKQESMIAEAMRHDKELRARIVAKNLNAYSVDAQAEACDLLASLASESIASGDMAMGLERLELALLALPSGREKDRSILEDAVRNLRKKTTSGIQHLRAEIEQILADADRRFVAGDLEGALQKFDSLDSLQETLEVVNARAWLLVQADRFSQAHVEYVKAAQLWPDNPDVHANLAGIRLRMGRHEQAESSLRRLLALRPNDPDALLALARVRLAQDSPFEASQYYRKLIESHPGHQGEAEAREQLERIEHQAIELSVIIPVRDRWELTEACLRSLKSTLEGVEYEVLLIDDGSTDKTSTLAPSGRLNRLQAPIPGCFAASCNAGARVAKGRHLVFLNNDTLAHSGWWQALRETLGNPGIGIVGALLTYPNGKIQHAGISFGPDGLPFHPNRGMSTDSALVRDARAVVGVTGACLAISASLFKKLGGFDEAYRFQVEDLDLCLRTWEHGLEVHLVPEARLDHLEGATPTREGDKDKRFREGISRLFSTWVDKGGFPTSIQKLPGFPAALRTVPLSGAPVETTCSRLLQPSRPRERCMTGNPAVTVVLPTKDRPVFLRRALGSLMEQTFQDFETVVVNDGGCDVAPVLEEFRSQGLDVRLEQHSETKGLAAARNTGIRNARGRWIAYLDDDDLYYPDHLAVAVETLERTGARVVYTDSNRAIEEEHKGVWTQLSCELAMSNPFDRDKFLQTNLTPVNNVVHDRDCWIEAGPIDESLPVLEDWENWIRYSRRWEFVHIPKVTTEIRWRSSGSNMTFQRKDRFQPTRERIAARVATNHMDPQLEREGISIVILVRDCLDFTRKCLDSIERNTPEPHEIIVVDNGSGQETEDWLRSWVASHPNSRMVRNDDNRGFAGGNNQGFALARGRFLLMLNNDTLVAPGWLARMLAVLRKHPECGAVGPMSNRISGPQLDRDASYGNDEGIAPHAMRRADYFDGRSEEILRAVGFCLLFRRQVLDAVGGLDERFGKGNFEDDDFSLRVRHAGWSLRMALDAFVHHEGGATFKAQKIDYSRSLLENWGLFLDKWGFPGDTPYEQGYSFPVSPPAEALERIPPPHPSMDHVVDDGGRIFVPTGSNPSPLDLASRPPRRSASGPRFVSALDKLSLRITNPGGKLAPAASPALPGTGVADGEIDLAELNRLLVRAEAAAARGELGEAEHLTEDAVARFPHQNLAWLARAMVLRGLGKFRKASEAIDRAIKERETPEALLESLQIHLLAGDAAPARKIEKALKERHAAWFKETRELFRTRGQTWPPDLLKPARAANKPAPPTRKGKR